MAHQLLLSCCCSCCCCSCCWRCCCRFEDIDTADHRPATTHTQEASHTPLHSGYHLAICMFNSWPQVWPGNLWIWFCGTWLGQRLKRLKRTWVPQLIATAWPPKLMAVWPKLVAKRLQMSVGKRNWISAVGGWVPQWTFRRMARVHLW